jgi:hypothetical protein
METKYITCIGSRKAPDDVLEIMYNVGARISTKENWVGRSGGAEGSDSAFEEGFKRNPNPVGKFEVFLPWEGFEGKSMWKGTNKLSYRVALEYVDEYKIVRNYYPSISKCSEGVKKLFCRNVNQVLGIDLKSPSHEIVCWTPKGELVGGTRIAMMIGNGLNIPVHNLYFEEVQREILERYEIN